MYEWKYKPSPMRCLIFFKTFILLLMGENELSSLQWHFFSLTQQLFCFFSCLSCFNEFPLQNPISKSFLTKYSQKCMLSSNYQWEFVIVALIVSGVILLLLFLASVLAWFMINCTRESKIDNFDSFFFPSDRIFFFCVFVVLST